MLNLNVELTELQSKLIVTQKLAVEYHEWDVARVLSDTIEAIAQAKSKTRETQIASCERFIHASRLSMKQS